MLNNNIAESQFSYVNLYSVGAIKKYGKLFKTVEELINILKDEKDDMSLSTIYRNLTILTEEKKIKKI